MFIRCYKTFLDNATATDLVKYFFVYNRYMMYN